MSAASTPTVKGDSPAPTSPPKFDYKTASQKQSTQASKPTDLKAREPFTADTVAGWINKTLLRTPVVLALPALVYLFDKRQSIAPSAYPAPSFKYLKELLFTEYKWIGYLFIFGLIKSINHHLNRYIANLGAYFSDKPNWSKEVVVVTGGSAGIGKSVVEILSHTKKAKVAVFDMAPPTYAPAPPGAPPIQYYKLDVSDAVAVKAAADQIRASFGDPTILMNNAGIASGTTILNVDAANAHRVWKVNTLANIITTQEFLPAMIKKNHGHVVTVASSASFMALPQMTEYSTSKSAALSFHEILRAELRSRYFAPRVRTSLAAPTKVQTALGDGMDQAASLGFVHPVLAPIQVGRAIVSALDSGLSQYMVMPGLMKMLPILRGVPDWMKRSVEVLGNTDFSVSDKTVDRAMKSGYGKDWEGAGAAARKVVMDRLDNEKGNAKK